MYGGENGVEPGKLRRCIAHEMRQGAPKWRARRDRRARDGGKRFSRGFCGALPPKESREPSVGDAERVSVREPPFGKFLAGSALYFFPGFGIQFDRNRALPDEAVPGFSTIGAWRDACTLFKRQDLIRFDYYDKNSSTLHAVTGTEQTRSTPTASRVHQPE